MVAELVTRSYRSSPGKENKMSGNHFFPYLPFKNSGKLFGVLQGFFCLADVDFFFNYYYYFFLMFSISPQD